MVPLMVDCAAYTKAGTHTAVNQDTVHASAIDAGLTFVAVASVFDGHGLLGERAASVAAAALPAIVAAESWVEEPEACMRRVIAALQTTVIAAHEPQTLPSTHEHLHATYTLSADGCSYSSDARSALGGAAGRKFPIDFGCTAAVAVLVPQTSTLIVGNAGDSAVLLCSASDDDELFISEVSVKHTASEAAEERRLEVACSSGVARLVDGYLQAIRGELRGHSLQPTRGLGHPAWAAYGVSAEPHVISLSVADGVDGVSGRSGFAIAVLSDGVTDSLDQQASSA